MNREYVGGIWHGKDLPVPPSGKIVAVHRNVLDGIETHYYYFLDDYRRMVLSHSEDKKIRKLRSKR